MYFVTVLASTVLEDDRTFESLPPRLHRIAAGVYDSGIARIFISLIDLEVECLAQFRYFEAFARGLHLIGHCFAAAVPPSNIPESSGFGVAGPSAAAGKSAKVADG